MLRYDASKKEMVKINKEPALFFSIIIVVIVWSFVSLTMIDKKLRYISVSVMALALAIAFLYCVIMYMSVTTTSLQNLRQSTFAFYADCLVLSTQSKIQWRLAGRGEKILSLSEDKEGTDPGKDQSDIAFGPLSKDELNSKIRWDHLLN